MAIYDPNSNQHSDGNEQETKELRYHTQNLDERNISDLMEWINTDELEAIIDENNGGIIGYINITHSNRINKILNNESD